MVDEIRARRAREQYRAGIRVRLIEMDDDDSRMHPGQEGTVRGVDQRGTIFVDWDNGSGLGLVPGVDKWERLS